MIISPKRGFEVSEYENRLDSIQKLMHESRMDVILRSEEHTSELQSRTNLVCRLLLEKKKKNT